MEKSADALDGVTGVSLDFNEFRVLTGEFKSIEEKGKVGISASRLTYS